MSPLLSNILLDELDKYLNSKGLKSVRFADDCSIYTLSKAASQKVGNEVHLFLKNKLDLPINRETPELGSAKGVHAALKSKATPTLSS